MRVLFLDRDGIINVNPADGEYVTRLADFIFHNNIFSALRAIVERGFKLFVITNQRCIARGMLKENVLRSIHKKMRERMEAEGLAVERIYVCPHDEGACECRKPRPGLIYEACMDYDIDLNRSYLLGNREKDIQAGIVAGVATNILYSPSGKYVGKLSPDFIISNFNQLTDIVV